MQHWPLEDTQVIGPPQSAMAISPAPAAPTRPSPARAGRKAGRTPAVPRPAAREIGAAARAPPLAASRANPPDQTVAIFANLRFKFELNKINN